MITPKETLINSLSITLSEFVTIPTKNLHQLLEREFYSYSILEVRETLPTTGDGSTTVEIFKKFAEYKIAQGVSKGTLEQYKLAIKQLWECEQVEINLMTADNINHFLACLRARGASDTTVKNKYMDCKSVFAFMYRKRYIVQDPFVDLVTPKANPRVKRPLTEKEIESIKVVCEKRGGIKSTRSTAMFNFMLDTGVRVQELCTIKLEDVDFDTKTVKVFGKGRKERNVYFTDKTLIRLQEYLNCREDLRLKNNCIMYIPSAPLFCSNNILCKPLTTSGVRCELTQIGIDSGVTRLHPHLIRATFATRLAEKDVNLNVIAKLLGHSDLGSIDRYVLMSDDKIQALIKQVS